MLPRSSNPVQHGLANAGSAVGGGLREVDLEVVGLKLRGVEGVAENASGFGHAPHKKNLLRAVRQTVFTAAVMILVNGCSSTGSYGVVEDAGTYDSDAIRVYLPDNAPSIRRGFHLAGPDKDRRGPSTEHVGIDILAPAGTAVIAPAKGVVERAFFEPMYGNHVELNHGRDENGLEVHTRFLHLQHRSVRKGDRVERGAQIGTLGFTGLLSGGIPHLHYELARHDPRTGRITATDPNEYWVQGAGMVTCFDSARQWPDQPFRTTYPVVCKD